MKWEYWVTVIDTVDLTKGLTEAGEQGWELLQVTFLAGYNFPVSGASKPDQYRLIFKKPSTDLGEIIHEATFGALVRSGISKHYD